MCKEGGAGVGVKRFLGLDRSGDFDKISFWVFFPKIRTSCILRSFADTLYFCSSTKQVHLNHISNQVGGAADYIWRKVTLISGVQLLSGVALLCFLLILRRAQMLTISLYLKWVYPHLCQLGNLTKIMQLVKNCQSATLSRFSL